MLPNCQLICTAVMELVSGGGWQAVVMEACLSKARLKGDRREAALQLRGTAQSLQEGTAVSAPQLQLTVAVSMSRTLAIEMGSETWHQPGLWQT